MPVRDANRRRVPKVIYVCNDLIDSIVCIIYVEGQPMHIQSPRPVSGDVFTHPLAACGPLNSIPSQDILTSHICLPEIELFAA